MMARIGRASVFPVFDNRRARGFVTNTLAVAMLGLAGAAIPEIVRAIAALRAGSGLSGRELLASTLTILLGLGVLLFDNSASSRLQIAVLGASFPQLFSGLVAATTSGRSDKAEVRGQKATDDVRELRATGPVLPAMEESLVQSRSVTDYLSWRMD
jgi:hypothetical protein